MKKAILIFLFPLFLCGAQIKDLNEQQYFNKGDLEFALFSNLGKYYVNSKSSNQFTGNPINNSEYSYNEFYAQLGVSAGYYIINNLSIEPELNLDLTHDNASVFVIGNLNYTFSKPGSNVNPFLRIGYGWGDYTNGAYFYGASNESEDYKIINTGGGIKVRYSNSIMFRLEVNYRIMSNTTSESYQYPGYSSSGKTETSISIISLSFGTSFFY